MGNVLPTDEIDEVYDLKGSRKNRHGKQVVHRGIMISNENCSSATLLRTIMQQLWQDVSFQRNQLLDYSLLFGIHNCYNKLADVTQGGQSDRITEPPRPNLRLRIRRLCQSRTRQLSAAMTTPSRMSCMYLCVVGLLLHLMTLIEGSRARLRMTLVMKSSLTRVQNGFFLLGINLCLPISLQPPPLLPSSLNQLLTACCHPAG